MVGIRLFLVFVESKKVYCLHFGFVGPTNLNEECKWAQAEWPEWEKLVANKWFFHSTEKCFYFLSKQWFELQPWFLCYN
jgi:hypothetical protein